MADNRVGLYDVQVESHLRTATIPTLRSIATISTVQSGRGLPTQNHHGLPQHWGPQPFSIAVAAVKLGVFRGLQSAISGSLTKR